jgi:hypothetical protein
MAARRSAASWGSTSSAVMPSSVSCSSTFGDDIRNVDRPTSWFYMRLGERVHDGAWSRVPTSLPDSFLAAEYRVPMFMMLSGVSLYMAAARKSGPIDKLSFYHPAFVSSSFRTGLRSP